MKMHEALATFNDNIDDIIIAMASNLRDDIRKTKKDGELLGTTWIADEVRKLNMEYRHGDLSKRLQTAIRFRDAQRRPPQAGRITEQMIDKARDYPIEDMYVGKLKKSGGKLWGLCPFHNDRKHPAFIIDKKNKYHCFTCGAHGDSIDFYMRTNNVNFIKAVKQLL